MQEVVRINGWEYLGRKSGGGKGSVFQFVVEVGVGKNISDPKTNECQNCEAVEGKQVLIVDDNATNLDILTHYAEQMGMVPKCELFPKQALELIKQESFDLIITDYHMPEMDGLSLAKQLKSLTEAPIFLLSSDQNMSTKEARKFTHSFHYKPIREAQFRKHILELFQINKKTKNSITQTFDTNLSQQIPLRILLAEDNLVNQKIARKMFAKLGYEIVLASNGQEAVDMALAEPYDVLFMDIQMPELDGVSASIKIQEQMGDSAPFIIAMTANAMKGDRESYLKAGMNDYLSKPMRVIDIEEVIRKNAVKIRTPNLPSQ